MRVNQGWKCLKSKKGHKTYEKDDGTQRYKEQWKFLFFGFIVGGEEFRNQGGIPVTSWHIWKYLSSFSFYNKICTSFESKTLFGLQFLFWYCPVLENGSDSRYQTGYVWNLFTSPLLGLPSNSILNPRQFSSLEQEILVFQFWFQDYGPLSQHKSTFSQYISTRKC